MNPILQEALAGEPVTVKFGREVYPLAYPIQAVILYKAETARLDRERAKAKDRLPLTREEKRELRGRRRKLLAEADTQRPAQDEEWIDENLTRFGDLLGEAMAVKAALEEDAAAGDSLYDKLNWWKISPESDPERMLLALWVGLHIFQPAKHPGKPDEYVETLTRQKLGKLIDLGNGEALTQAIATALRAHLIVASDDSESAEKEAVPNAPPPAAPAEMAPLK
jgi:hypothetical protein